MIYKDILDLSLKKRYNSYTFANILRNVEFSTHTLLFSTPANDIYIKFYASQKGGVVSLTNEDLQKIGDLMEKKLSDKVPKLMTEFWEKTMLPWFEKYYVTKNELKQEFEKFEIKMEQKFSEVNDRLLRIGDKINFMSEDIAHLDKRLCRVEAGIIVLRKESLEQSIRTERKFESHVDRFRRIHGVAEPLPTYQIEEKQQK